MSLYSCVPSDLDPQTQGTNKILVRPIRLFFCPLKDSFVPSVLSPQTQGMKSALYGRLLFFASLKILFFFLPYIDPKL